LNSAGIVPWASDEDGGVPAVEECCFCITLSSVFTVELGTGEGSEVIYFFKMA